MLSLPPDQAKELLIKEGLTDAATFDALREQSDRMGQGIVDLLVSRGIVTTDYWYGIMSRYFGVPLADLSNRVINEEILAKLPEDLARQKGVLLFSAGEDGMIDAAMEDPSNLETVEFLERRLRARIRPFLATPQDLRRGFALYGRRITEDFQKIIEENIRMSLKTRSGSITEAAQELPIVAIVDNLLSYANALRSSDIHIEILEDGILVRFRIDGILHEVIRMPKEAHPAVTARIKLLAALKIDEHMKPQDGRVRYRLGRDILDVRVSVIPTFYGEKIEKRLLAASQKPLSLEEVGLLPDMQKIVGENIKKSYGMILVTGPTGSGKTTTLYSIMSMLNRPEVNIVTIEDPIEYDMKYINQTQINALAGITFASGLRSILRQDPNIIMVGEIRDEETAEISVHAALTGHLLLSSLHTNDAVTSIPRLVDMKIASFLVAAVLNVVIAQRLVRKVCLDCIVSYPPDMETASFLEKELAAVNPYTKIKTPRVLYKGHGCSACGNTGFRGRIGIFELLEVTDEIRKIIMGSDFSLDQIGDAAKKAGMMTMFEDGLRKVETGITTVEEVLRVMRE
ncbi:type II/IV secretion system protein [Candidatus Wolfebacteria bacterium]|nr:type II/IV secretion system protein [Candidatus Wolfebacteria bacterium]